MPQTYLYYGMRVSVTTPDVERELYAISKGGEWKDKTTGQKVGNGLLFHFREAIKLIWPEVVFHPWLDLFIEQWLKHKNVGAVGPRNSGKSFDATICHLVDYYAFPYQTTTLICSTTRERLEDRIWGEIKKYHRAAKSRFSFLPGNLIEGRQRIVSHARYEAAEGRDFRNGLIGVPCRRGDKYVGIADFQGIKNKRVRLCGDEGSGLPKAFVDAIATLDIQGDQKVTLMGNLATTTDALGVFCEPHVNIGGWEGGIDQTPKTKTWRTRFNDGICIQFPGSDSPNMATKPGEDPPYPFLMTRQAMEQDAAVWGKDDWHYLMFNEGRLPRGQGTHRIITRQLCLRSLAMEEPNWLNTSRTTITCLDAAFRATGGDRCVLMRLQFGVEIQQDANTATRMVESLINEAVSDDPHRMILALLDTIVIPIEPSDLKSPEDQIVMFCKRRHEEWNAPPENFFYDAGMRTSLVTAFARLWTPRVNSVDFGGKPSLRKVSRDIDVVCKDYYQNFVTELWYSSRFAVEAKQIRGMSDDLVAEGCMREWRHLAGTNKIQVETKDEMKAKTGKSPDLYDCFVTGIEGARQRGFLIARLAEPETQESNSWKRELMRKAAEQRRSHDLIED